MAGDNIFRSAFDGMVRARERHAEQYVKQHLLNMDDATLRSLGYDRATLLKRGLRRGQVR